MISEMKGLEDENRRLKKMFAELSMQMAGTTKRSAGSTVSRS